MGSIEGMRPEFSGFFPRGRAPFPSVSATRPTIPKIPGNTGSTVFTRNLSTGTLLTETREFNVWIGGNHRFGRRIFQGIYPRFPRA